MRGEVGPFQDGGLAKHVLLNEPGPLVGLVTGRCGAANPNDRSELCVAVGFAFDGACPCKGNALGYDGRCSHGLCSYGYGLQ